MVVGPPRPREQAETSQSDTKLTAFYAKSRRGCVVRLRGDVVSGEWCRGNSRAVYTTVSNVASWGTHVSVMEGYNGGQR